MYVVSARIVDLGPKLMWSHNDEEPGPPLKQKLIGRFDRSSGGHFLKYAVKYKEALSVSLELDIFKVPAMAS